MAKKVYVVAIALLLIYSVGATAYIIGSRRAYESKLDDSIRKAQALDEELGRARTLIDSTSLGLERALGRVAEMQSRDRRITELIGAIKTAISGLIGYIAEAQGAAPEN